MIEITSITLKNFLSIGNQTQAVSFTKENLTLVVGENLDQGIEGSGNKNGVGKSSLVSAISYALFGVALSNIKKDNLINKFNNKNMLVTLSFTKDNTKYRIERGRKPNVCRLFVNDQMQSSESDEAQGDMRETQKDIDQLLGGMTHEMFKHIVALNTYSEPFLSLRANDQRAIIEQLLGITLLSEKSENLKLQIKDTKDKIFQETTEIEAIKKSNDKIQQSIDTLVLRQTAWNKQYKLDLKSLKKSIDTLESIDIEQEIVNHQILNGYNDLANQLAQLQKEYDIFSNSLIQANKTLDKYQLEVNQLKNKRCHACDQELHDHKHQELLSIASTNLEEALSYQLELITQLDNISLSINNIQLPEKPSTFYESIDLAYKHQTNLESLKNQLSLKQSDKCPYDEQIDELKNKAIQEINWDSINQLNLLKDHQEFLLKLLTNKDSFIRKKIIDQNLAFLNSRLTYYLEQTGLPHSVTFQNDLSVEIMHLGQEFDFDNLSRGERNRLILSLSWAFRDVWENLYQPINLLIIDELIDNGLDTTGVDNALGILKHIGRERNKNIFLISHKDELIGRVNNVLKVIKENGYTSFSSDLEVN